MGYRSIIRSSMSAYNRAARESEKEERRELRETERIQRKTARVDEKMVKVTQALDDIYAKGKIDKNRYEELKKRKFDISLELIVIAKTPGFSLAKRYMTGAINKDEFGRVQKYLLPPELFEEKRNIKESVNNIEKELKKFRDNCKNEKENQCQYCGKEKSLFNPIKIEDGLRLCGKCRSWLLNVQNYKGFLGNYFTVSPMRITFSDIDNGIEVDANLKNELL